MLAGLVRKVASLGAPASANALGFESCLRNVGNHLMRVSQEASRGYSTGNDTTGGTDSNASNAFAADESAPAPGPKLDLLDKYMALENKSRAEKGKIAIDEFRRAFKRHESDTGSSAVQVAALSYKISMMTEHLQEHRKDNHSRRGLMSMLVRRQKLLKYMRRKEPDDYQMVLKSLGLKDRTFVGDKY